MAFTIGLRWTPRWEGYEGEVFDYGHRIYTDLFLQNFIKAKRFFVGEPVWLPYNRPVDDMECRKDYVKKLQEQEF